MEVGTHSPWARDVVARYGHDAPGLTRGDTPDAPNNSLLQHRGPVEHHCDRNLGGLLDPRHAPQETSAVRADLPIANPSCDRTGEKPLRDLALKDVSSRFHSRCVLSGSNRNIVEDDLLADPPCPASSVLRHLPLALADRRGAGRANGDERTT